MHIEWSLGSGFFDWAPETQVTRAVAGLSASCSQVYSVCSGILAGIILATRMLCLCGPLLLAFLGTPDWIF